MLYSGQRRVGYYVWNSGEAPTTQSLTHFFPYCTKWNNGKNWSQTWYDNDHPSLAVTLCWYALNFSLKSTLTFTILGPTLAMSTSPLSTVRPDQGRIWSQESSAISYSKLCFRFSIVFRSQNASIFLREVRTVQPIRRFHRFSVTARFKEDFRESDSTPVLTRRRRNYLEKFCEHPLPP